MNRSAATKLFTGVDKVMKKKQSIVVLIVMIVLTALLGYTVVVGWGSGHTGSARNIRTGLDLCGDELPGFRSTNAKTCVWRPPASIPPFSLLSGFCS